MATDEAASSGDASAGELTDQLPDDLQPEEFVGDYEFPDNSRRRIQGAIYLVAAALCVAVAVLADGHPVVNDGWWWAAVGLSVAGVIAITSGWSMQLDEQAALVRAQNGVGFPVGYASAQQVWHGLRSRPTWRVLVYSAEPVPTRRALVLVDAVDGRIIEQLVEAADPDEWGE